MNLIRNLKNLSKLDVAIAGGKGASLGEIKKAKIMTPPGFVVLASAYRQFLKEADLGVEIEAVMRRINYESIKTVEEASKKIRDLIYNAEFPKDIGKEILKEFIKFKAKYAAVRSSATAEDSSIASWAGELESYLNVTKNNLLESVKNCWSSFFTPRAIFYCYEKNLDKQKVFVAVVVQKMIQSEISGVCFTVHSVTEDKAQMVIEAGYGLGGIMVGGKITPDTYVVRKHKKDFRILDKNISKQKTMMVRDNNGTKEIRVPKLKQKKQKITDKQILKLAKICLNIERHYSKPQDIEWGFEKGKFYIVQSRPITTLFL